MNDEDLDYLDDFLLYRIDENTDTQGKDEGVLDLSELDGLLTAIVQTSVESQLWWFCRFRSDALGARQRHVLP